MLSFLGKHCLPDGVMNSPKGKGAGGQAEGCFVAAHLHHASIVSAGEGEGKNKIKFFERFIAQPFVLAYNAGMKPTYNLAKLRNALALTGWTQQEIARKTRLSEGTISYIINGQQARPATIQAIAAIVQLTLADLLIPEPEAGDA